MTFQVVKRGRVAGLRGPDPSPEALATLASGAARAVTAAGTAEAVAGPSYASTDAGLAATVNGQTFAVSNGDGTVTVYLNQNGSAVAQRRLATSDALAAPGGAGLVGFSPGIAAPQGSAAAKMQQVKTLGDYVTHATAQEAAMAAETPLFVAAPAVSTLADRGAVVSTHYGNAQVRLADGHKLGKQYSRATYAPTQGSWDDVQTAFDGDVRQSLYQHEHHIDAGALTVPAVGYRYTQEAAGWAGYLVNKAGGNTQLSGNDGRTAANYMFLKADQYGGGDAVAITATGFCSGITPPGATSWLAMPAVALYNGQITIGRAGNYANAGEFLLDLGGYDAAAIGWVVNIKRDLGDTVGGLGSYTAGFRAQSVGTFGADAAFSAAGLWKVGLDTTPATLTFEKCAIATRSGQRWFGNASSSDGLRVTNYGFDWIERSPDGFWSFVWDNVSRLRINGSFAAFDVMLRLPTLSAADLPAANAERRGCECFISDANATTPRTPVVGGGSNFVKAFCTGTQWLIGY